MFAEYLPFDLDHLFEQRSRGRVVATLHQHLPKSPQRLGDVGVVRRKDTAPNVQGALVRLFAVNGASRANVCLPELRQHLDKRKAEARRKLEVGIRGDRATTFEPVQRAMRIAAESGIAKVGLAALQNDTDAPVPGRGNPRQGGG